MAVTVGSVCGAVTLLMCVLGGEAVDLLRAAAASGNSLQAPKMHCWCPSYPNVTLCSWPKLSHPAPLHYIATYWEIHGQSSVKQGLLIQPNSSSSFLIPPSSSSSDEVWHCLMPNLKLLTNYMINITAVYPGGSSYNLSGFLLEDIVKPDAPVDVRVSPLDFRSLLVKWSPPLTWTNMDIAPLKYHIQYKWESRGSEKVVNVGPFEEVTEVTLKGLTPGRSYWFQVCAKELLGLGECSDWSSPVEVTMPSATA